ncbi:MULTISPECIES: hypothetical protein [Okeania]|uniref:hypothetical protein n=1 Tax=Okeania TaxID=1458928 RepID=UPI001374DD3B|nr:MULTISPECIES: hypothetical protein [Okeania]NES65774.1 hypothetical protein [Okeania sp. SIO2D1]NET11990.1 hypothetical protein [Okeania sp. SIO1H6]NEP72560.1 hypothetical protein [Okeania sp. SIO2G5]NEP95379.1 hypothetical protein [Okeania sp. SIO2F5]NEQ71680.1 hypothetical protein [Okeania sp. SIO2C9]
MINKFIEEGVRSQESGVRRENCLWIVNEGPLRVYVPQTILIAPIDGGVLNP